MTNLSLHDLGRLGTFSATQADIDALIGPSELVGASGASSVVPASLPAPEHAPPRTAAPKCAVNSAAVVPAPYTSKLEAALDHASHGFLVFPLRTNAKNPRFEGWQDAATTDPAQIKRWWSQWPNANIGILTTPLLVVDIDPRNGGETSAEAVHKENAFPKTLCSRTQGGGAHMIYLLPQGVLVNGKSHHLGPGIDIKSSGGLIVAPGSTFEGRPYRWLNERTPVFAPQWLIDKCEIPLAKAPNAGTRVAAEDEWARKAAWTVTQNAPAAGEGARNTACVALVNRLFDFGVELDTALAYAMEWTTHLCSPPMDIDEVRTTVTSAMRSRKKAIGCAHWSMSGFEPVSIYPQIEPVGAPELAPTENSLPDREYNKLYAYLFRNAPLVEGPSREPAALNLANALILKCSPDQTLTLLRVWNEAACEPELEGSALQSAIDIATRNYVPPISAPPKTDMKTASPLIPFKEPWGEPVDLWPTAHAPAELPLDAVPEIVARFAYDRGQRLGIAPGAAAAALITSLGSLVPAGNELQMRQFDPHWTVRPILWTAIIGEPGSNKSAALSAAVAPIKAIEDKWRLQYAAETRRADMAKATAAATKKQQGSTAGGEPSSDIVPSRPVYRQKIVNDATTEALAPLLAENSSGLLCYVDELAALFGGMDAYRQKGGKDRPFWLQAKDGGALTINRKTSDRIVVKNCAISILGSIQPDKIRKLSPGLSEDCFLQRFSLVYIRRDGPLLDLPPDTDLDRALSRVASSLVESADSARFRFAPEADVELRKIEAFKSYEIARPNTSNFIRQWLDKLPNEFGRVALAFHHIEHCTSDAASVFEDPAPELINADTARRARRYLTDFIYSHVQAFSLQAPQSSAGSDHALWIAGFILAGEKSRLDARDIYRSYKALERDSIPRVMGDLELLDWVRPIKFNARAVATGWAVNPAAHDGRFTTIAESERLRRADVREKVAQGRPRQAEQAATMGEM